MAARTVVPAIELGDVATTAVAPVDVTQLRDTLFGLTYGQIATAIEASPLFDSVDAAAAEVVAAGLAKLGRAEIAERTAWLVSLSNTKWLGETPALRRHGAAMLAEFWRGEHRFNRAHRIAERVWAKHGTTLADLAAVA
ncbi:hypothetical protein [Actinoplanes regularis]|uniref:hypothetical protein n=1 Tax=Actinoplanes regularis TaxID=52697 RepID=UPI0024A469DB|nr:hypothetical protein [Actinoplanes regularis]GLW34081.1 hypothetical protein Areg01_70180 [Actinoplanes regularis]